MSERLNATKCECMLLAKTEFVTRKILDCKTVSIVDSVIVMQGFRKT